MPVTTTAPATTTNSSQPHPTSSSPNGANSANKKNNKNKWKPLPIDVAKTSRSNSSKPLRNGRRIQSTREDRDRPRDRERTRDENSENRPAISRSTRSSRFSSNRTSVSSNYRGRSRGGFSRQGPSRRGIHRAVAGAVAPPGYAFTAGANQGENQTFVLSGTHYYNAVPTAFIEMDALSVKEAIKKQV